MKVTIAGYGSIGQFAARTLGRAHEIAAYDPPKGLGREEDLFDTDIVVIAVPTPSLPDGSCDTRLVEETVAKASPRRAIVCHSTVSIGTMDRLIQTYRKPLVYVPEYAGESEGHLYRNVENRTFFFLGGYAPATEAVREMLAEAYGPDTRTFVQPPTVVETVKYMENAFLALKVGFCNSFYDLCQGLGIEYEAVRELWLQDSRVGESHTLVTEERGYGGKCLPKDVAAVCATARGSGTPLDLLETLQEVNTRQRMLARMAGAVVVGAGAPRGGA